MMKVTFDLISDLHVESWPTFDWTNQATAPYCVVCGDVARDRDRLLEALEHLGKCYPGGVFYVDGNEEHRDYYHDLGSSYRDLAKDVNSIKNVVYIQDNLIIIKGVAFLGTNAWWTYDFDPTLDLDDCIQRVQDHFGITNSQAANISGVAYDDANYMTRSIRKLQTHTEVGAIVVMTHTVPASWLISHDPDLSGQLRFNGMGNSHISNIIDQDTENKIHTWCFGHYHRPVDQDLGGIRYVCHPRGRGNTPWNQNPYYAKRIEIEY
jgi:predicted phosphodiesterase